MNDNFLRVTVVVDVHEAKIRVKGFSQFFPEKVMMHASARMLTPGGVEWKNKEKGLKEIAQQLGQLVDEVIERYGLDVEKMVSESMGLAQKEGNEFWPGFATLADVVEEIRRVCPELRQVAVDDIERAVEKWLDKACLELV